MNTSADLLKELRIDRKAPPPARRPRRALWILLPIALVALVVAGWMVFGRSKPIEVETAPAVGMSSGSAAASVLDASGYVVARRMATVSSKITGKVLEVRIEEGQRVEQGEIMATLDPIDAEAQRRLSSSQLEAARSQAGSVQAQLREAESSARRLGTLAGQQLVSQSQLEQAVAQRDALRAQLATTQRNVQVARDQVSIAGNNVDNTVVRAPFAGVVIAKAAQPGEIVSPLSAGGGFTRTGIGTIVDMDSLEVEVEVGEAFIGRVQPKMPIEATLNAYQDWKIPGEVIAIIPTADRSKATVKVRVALEAKDPRIVPDMGVKVSFLEAPKAAGQPDDRGVRVPSAAIVERDGEEVAFVVTEDDTVQRRSLKLGRALAADRQVLEGVSAGETVVVNPPDELEDGATVALAEDAAD